MGGGYRRQEEEEEEGFNQVLMNDVGIVGINW